MTSETATILVNPSIVVTKPPPAGSIVIAARSPASVAVTSTVMANDDERDRTVSAAIQQVDEDAEVKNEIIIST